MDVSFITGNKGKFQTAANILNKYGINLVQKKLELSEMRSMNVEEIAVNKAQQASNQLKEPLIVEDSGLFIQSLNGFPGPFVNLALETIGPTGIIKLLENKNRECEFRFTLAYFTKPTDEIKTFSFINNGSIATELSQHNEEPNSWSAISKIFIPTEYTKTLADFTSQEHEQYTKKWEKKCHFTQFGKWIKTKRDTDAEKI